MTDLDGSVAVVTGASRGIGRSIALTLGRHGARVVACARDDAALRSVVREIEAAGGTGLAVRADVTSDGDVARLAVEVSRAFGPAAILVNNAGAYRVAPFTEATLDDFRSLIEVNYLATVRVTKAFLAAMIERGSGRVINVASTAGKYGSRNQSMYNGSKHAVVGLTRCLGLELAPAGVRVNAICPGFVDTPILDDATPQLARTMGVAEAEVRSKLAERVPIGRLLTPGEVADMVLYLASPGADGVTGQAFTIDGGLILV